MIHLHTFGALDVSGSGGDEARKLLAQPKRVALLCYLAIAKGGGFHRRDTLLALFWPELNDAHARGALSQALTFIRNTLGAEVIVTRGVEEIGIDRRRLACDAVTFAERIAAGDDAAALALYTGELLDGVFLPDAPQFEQWVEGERRRLRDLARSSARRLATTCEAAGDIPGALRWARYALTLAPYDEPALRYVLDLMDRHGDRAGAVREFESFAARLRTELDVEPSPETTARVESIRGRVDRNGVHTDRPAPTPASSTKGAASPSTSRRPLIPLALLTIGTAALLLAGAAVLAATRRTGLDPRLVVVIPLENRTGDTTLNALGQIAADWMLQGLARTGIVEVVPGFQVAAAMRGLGPVDAEGRSARIREVARRLQAGTAVTGSYHRRGTDFEFQAEVVDVDRGRLVRVIEATRGGQHDPMPAIDALRHRALGAVAFRFDARVPQELYADARPPNYEAYQAFVTGENFRNVFQTRRALAYFEKAHALDTSFTLALFLSAIQHLNLRDYAAADSLTRRLSASRDRLPPFEQQLLEWADATVRGDLPRVLEASRGFIRFGEGFRGQVGVEALHANRPRETVERVNADRERSLGGQSTEWKMVFARRVTEAYHRLEDYEQELEQAQRARRRTPGALEPLLLEMRALVALGRVDEAGARVSEALTMPPDPMWSPGQILLRASDELRVHGHAPRSREALLRAIAWYRALPDSAAGDAWHGRYLATALLRADSLSAAEHAFRELAIRFPGDPYYPASLAVIRARLGDTEGARAIMRTALDRNPPYDFGHHLYEQARVAAALGDGDGALDLMRQAFVRGFRFAFAGTIGGTARPPDGAPHLDPVFDRVRGSAGWQQLARGQ